MTTLANLRTRLMASLAEDASLVFTEMITDEAIRHALEEISAVYGTQLTIEDLDGVTGTTLPDKDIPCLLTGAAGHAISAIALSRYTDFSHSVMEDVKLTLHGDKLMTEFRYQLNDLRTEGMQTVPDLPHAPIEWEENYFHDPEVDY